MKWRRKRNGLPAPPDGVVGRWKEGRKEVVRVRVRGGGRSRGESSGETASAKRGEEEDLPRG